MLVDNICILFGWMKLAHATLAVCVLYDKVTIDDAAVLRVLPFAIEIAQVFHTVPTPDDTGDSTLACTSAYASGEHLVGHYQRRVDGDLEEVHAQKARCCNRGAFLVIVSQIDDVR